MMLSPTVNDPGFPTIDGRALALLLMPIPLLLHGRL